MRVTDRMNYDQVTKNLQKNRSEMSELQSQAATQKKVTKPSDDPMASARILGLRSDDRINHQFMRNIQYAKSFLEATDTSLSEATEILLRLKELAIQQANDASSNQETRKMAAIEVAQMFSQMIQIGNRKIGDRYLFAGQRTTEMPFTIHGDYQGDSQDLNIQIQKDAFLTTNLSGDKVFLGRNIGPDGIIRGNPEVPKNSQDIEELKWNQQEQQIEEQKKLSFSRDLAQEQDILENNSYNKGIDILRTIKHFEIALKNNDRDTIQQSIDWLDHSIHQLTQSRAQVGARLNTLNLNFESLQKNNLDNKIIMSQLEDVDLFQLVSDMSKADTALKATMESSSRLIQPSLLDFLK